MHNAKIDGIVRLFRRFLFVVELKNKHHHCIRTNIVLLNIHLIQNEIEYQMHKAL